jgi:ribosomal protein S27AE
LIPVPRSRKINLEKVLALLNTTCPKCGFAITPDQVKRVDFERMECPKCGEKFRPGGVGW